MKTKETNNRHSTEQTHGSDQLNTTLTIFSYDTTLPRLKRQSSIHFNTKPVILNTSTQPSSTTHQNVRLSQQQVSNFHKITSKKQRLRRHFICKHHQHKHL